MKFLTLIEIFLRQTRFYLLTTIFFLILLPIAFLLDFSKSYFSTSVVAGTLTLYIFIDGFLSISQQISFMKHDGHITLLYTSGAPKWMVGLALAFLTTITSIPLIIILVILAENIVKIDVNWLGLAITAFISLLVSSFMGLDLGLSLDQRKVNQLSQVLSFGLSFFAATFIPFYVLPLYFKIPTLLEPTTYVAQELRYNLDGQLNILWYIGISIYAIIFLIIYMYVRRKP
ncbi:hypothetical protein [Acidianus brierleyi]|uniref:ABC transporter permease n=1 Tax=Acidianus brierleyi TaxID=41673 RepID=A0A2U9ICC4_9CREN|nr:hypothetical protein [Acidianus brierleyi]AWR93663.1 hypothetical protein DFR85_02565 [Acidianus brierleyi]